MQQHYDPKPTFSQQVQHCSLKAIIWSCLQHQHPKQHNEAPTPRQAILHQLHQQQSHIKHWHIILKIKQIKTIIYC